MALFDPPPGWEDMLSDALRSAPLPESEPLKVPGLGTFQAREPRPRSIAVLAMTQNDQIDDLERLNMVNLFVRQHLGEGEYERVVEGMIDDVFPEHGTVGKLMEAIATWGTARPYLAVVNLAVTCAQSWRRIRPRLINNGIADPMQLTSMGALLDVTEDIVLECMVTGDRTKDDMARDSFYNRLYAPIVVEGEKVGPPPGWSDEETDDAFDAFAAQFR
jgi:hypothetical protein